MSFWESIKSEIKNRYNVVLLYVIESNGSSPGRQGFKMLVSQSGLLAGSVGGGIMEHKLVELCRLELLKAPFKPFIKRQIHQSDVVKDKSGMICSGAQTIAFYHLDSQSLALIQSIIKAINTKEKLLISYSQNGITLFAGKSQQSKFILTPASYSNWKLIEDIHFAPQLHIIGGGHVSLALSKFAKELSFLVTVYDDRENLNTVTHNNAASTKHITNYEQIGKHIAQSADNYLVIMSFGYKTDKVILKSLLRGSYKYVGMMGSQAKIDTLFKELKEEGISNKRLEKVHAPIGLPINSKTPNEIAISILGQIIQIKNATLNPQGTLV